MNYMFSNCDLFDSASKNSHNDDSLSEELEKSDTDVHNVGARIVALSADLPFAIQHHKGTFLCERNRSFYDLYY